MTGIKKQTMSTLIIGLGNPGKKYEKTRHNAGFMAVDFVIAQLGEKVSDFKENKKLKALVAKIKFENQDIILAKPTTFMNDSGLAVNALVKHYFKKGKILSAIAPMNIGAKEDKLIIIYDELDLPFGTIRVRDSGSSAGHNGIKSIIGHLGTDKFWRMRIGTKNELADKIPADRFVLKNFSATEIKILKEKILPEIEEKIKEIIEK
jgi:PTH1 family peptidyl-tRNA hydrolase